MSTTLASLRSRLASLDEKATQGEWLGGGPGRMIMAKNFTGDYSAVCYDVHGGSPEAANANADLVSLLCSQSTRRALLAALDVIEPARKTAADERYVDELLNALEAFRSALSDIPEGT